MSKASLTKIEVKTNAKGVTFAVMKEVNVFGEDRGYGVWVLRTNYRAGRDVKTWRFIQVDMTLEAATALLAKKTK